VGRVFDVLLYDRLAGTLEPRGRGVRFTYAPSALDDPAAPPISLSLPKRPEHYPDSVAGPFFRNLLPEDTYRRLVAAAAGTAPENNFALLGAIGGECPGAVSIWPHGERPSVPPDYDVLTHSEIEALLSRGDRRAFGSALVRGRLSLAGAQEKIALFRDPAGVWYLPLNGSVTTHILKQATVEFEHLLENEMYCMLLAEAVGLEAASVGLASDAVRVFCTERFDRERGNRSVYRLHQEDFCQVLAVDPARKYEHDGGPGIKRCAQVISRHSAAPVVDLDRLVRWVGFNYLVGNEDAHAKNLALLYGPGETRLTPFYDIVSTEVYAGLERRLSMKVGRSWDSRNVQASDWKQLAGHVGLPPAAVREALAGLVEGVEAVQPGFVDRVEAACGPSPVYDRIGEIVQTRIAFLSSELARLRR